MCNADLPFFGKLILSFYSKLRQSLSHGYYIREEVIVSNLLLESAHKSVFVGKGALLTSKG